MKKFCALLLEISLALLSLGNPAGSGYPRLGQNLLLGAAVLLLGPHNGVGYLGVAPAELEVLREPH